MREPAQFTIGGLAQAAGVNVETVRYYQRRGLLPEPARPPGGIRRYDRAALDRLGFIKSAQRLGFSLEEVAVLLKLDDGAHCREARTIAERKLREVRGRIADLRRIERALHQLTQTCASSGGDVSCPLIQALLGR
ncbi:MAG: Hg(II)-responsive transcriptional regulator [Pseudomonadota bacterium]